MDFPAFILFINALSAVAKIASAIVVNARAAIQSTIC